MWVQWFMPKRRWHVKYCRDVCTIGVMSQRHSRFPDGQVGSFSEDITQLVRWNGCRNYFWWHVIMTYIMHVITPYHVQGKRKRPCWFLCNPFEVSILTWHRTYCKCCFIGIFLQRLDISGYTWSTTSKIKTRQTNVYKQGFWLLHFHWKTNNHKQKQNH